MKHKVLKSAAALAVACAVGSGPVWAQAPQTQVYGPPVTATTQITMQNLTTSNPLIPGDLYRTGDNQVDHQQAAKFAWLEFMALVAPNKSDAERGVPGGSFGSVMGGSDSTYPLVWETFQHRTELFPYTSTTPTATPPQPWTSPPKYVYPIMPSVGPGVDFTLYNNLDEASQIFQNHIYFPNPSGDPFEILFEAKGNYAEWSYLNSNYNTGSGGLLPHPAAFPANMIEVKAAWRPIESIPADQRSRYHVATVLFYENAPPPANPISMGGTPVAKNGQYALIALHIIHKTANYPSFIFATFEQVDQYINQVTHEPTGVYFNTLYADAANYSNPPCVEHEPSGKYKNDYPPQEGYQCGSYYFAVDQNGFSADSNKSSTSFDATVNPTRTFDVSDPKAWPNGNVYVAPKAMPDQPANPGFYPPPLISFVGQDIKVTQPPTTNGDVDAVNSEVLSLMQQVPGGAPVWQYYKLKGVQAIPTSDETTKDYYLANITVESSQAGIQLFRGALSPNPGFYPVPNIRNAFNVSDEHTGDSYSMGGCMGCHGAAQKGGFDFSFILLEGGNGAGFGPPDASNIETMEDAIAAAKYRQSFIRRGAY